jgi:hypothetical protein
MAIISCISDLHMGYFCYNCVILWNQVRVLLYLAKDLMLKEILQGLSLRTAFVQFGNQMRNNMLLFITR